ncbi:MAG: DUF1934 domain-containing protein [Acholeplasmatales bacterium]|nr:DUF1934 domain-containing protein [Acholeplasmatales bacterium]
MKVHFYSFTDGKKSISYETDLTLLDKGYRFKDHSIENTSLEFHIIDQNHVQMYRNGAVNSKMDFIIGKSTKSSYFSDSLSFEFDVLTHAITVKNNALSIEYDYYYQGDKIGKIKVGLLIK